MRNVWLILKPIVPIITGKLQSLIVQTTYEKLPTPTLDISIDYSNDPFYTQIWFWIIVALLLFILLLLLIVGPRKKKKPVKPKV